MSKGTLQHFLLVGGPLLTSKQRLVHGACPHAHRSVSAALIRKRYLLSLVMPVRSWASTLVSYHDNRSYSCRVCFPGSAVSTHREYLPVFSGSSLLGAAWDRAILRVVDFILEICFCETAYSCIRSSLVGIHRMLTRFPCLCSLVISL